LADAEHLPAADSAFDAVMCGFGVFFFPDPARAFAEVRRVLRPTGRFAASTFADGVAGFPWSTELAREVGRPSPWKQSPVVKVDGLRAALHDTGFTSVVTTRVERRFSFNDIEHYQAWYGTHGGAQLLHELADDAGRLGHWRRRSTVLLERDGYAFTQRVDLTVADR
jgi:ubiquinone/menaquinone biosynthesis C-methylase UbiE